MKTDTQPLNHLKTLAGLCDEYIPEGSEDGVEARDSTAGIRRVLDAQALLIEALELGRKLTGSGERYWAFLGVASDAIALAKEAQNEDRAKDRLELVRRAQGADARQPSDVIESALEAALVALGRHGGNSEPTYANGKLLDDQARATRNAWLQVRAALGVS